MSYPKFSMFWDGLKGVEHHREIILASLVWEKRKESCEIDYTMNLLRDEEIIKRQWHNVKSVQLNNKTC